MLVNFDYDGVLVDSLERLTVLAAQAQREVGSGRAPTAEDFRLLQNLTFAGLAERIGVNESRVEDFCEAALHLQEMDPTLPPLIEGAAEMIRSVSAYATVTVISSSSRTEIRKVLDGAGAAECVQRIFDGADRRPKSDKIREAMALFAAPPSSTFMVGDSRSDIVQGKLAGVRTVAVAWGYQPRDRLALEEPDFMVESIAQLVGLLSDERG